MNDPEQEPRPSSGTLGDELRGRLRDLVEEACSRVALDELREIFGRMIEELTSTSQTPSEQGGDPREPGVSEPLVPVNWGMVGNSPAMREMFALLAKVAGSNVSVLILGETGTGKELVARALHQNSSRRSKPFMAENCAAVPANLLESELFGHKKGAFTGAVVDREGHFKVADGGTVFLDEIGDMPLSMQAKLLRVLQDGEIRPVGSNKSSKVDVRLLAATNKDLVAMCREGAFREDLYYRLNVITVKLPRLSERKGDIPHLVRFFLRRASEELGREVEITPEALAALEGWSWPGNVRELENEILRAAVLCAGRIGLADLSRTITAGVEDG